MKTTIFRKGFLLFLFTILISPVLAHGAGNYSWTSNSQLSGLTLNGITSSADGTKLAITVSGGYIQISTDSGLTWSTSTASDSRSWRPIASSADGSKIIAGVDTGYIYISSDGGATWATSTNAGSNSWAAITSSADGTKLAATGFNSYIYTSSDSGATWATSSPRGMRTWRTITSSADGTKVATADNSGYIYTSSDSGATWATSTAAGPESWYAITSSADGTKLAAAPFEGYIVISTDSGATWSTSTTSGFYRWRGLSFSDDGMKLVAVSSSGYVRTTVDGGATWAEPNLGFANKLGVTSSADGAKIALVEAGGIVRLGVDDIAAPVVTDIVASSASTTFSISFDTDEEATTTLRYGVGNASSTVSSSELLSHSLDLEDLVPCSAYEYSISTSDQYGNGTSTVPSFFVTTCPNGVSVVSTSTSAVSYSSGDLLSVGGFSADIPAGYSEETEAIQVSELYGEFAEAPSDLAGIGSQYQVLLFDTPTTTIPLDIPAEFSISYEGEDVSGYDTSSFSLYVATSTTWTALDNCIVDTDLFLVTCDTSSLGTFALFGSLEEEAPAHHSGGRSGSRRSSPSVAVPVVAAPVPAAPAAASSSAASFTRNLTIGDTGSDVLALQKLLNSLGFTLAASGPGSPGNETSMFGGLTRAALVRYQLSKGIAPAIGYFGPITRASISR